MLARIMTMRWQTLMAYAGFVLAAWAGFAGWQWHEYCHERDVARDTLRRQADSLSTALIGGIRSHRRLGPFFEDQLQGTLDQLVRAEDVLAVAVVAQDGRATLSAGQAALLRPGSAVAGSESWEASGYRFVRPFELSPEPVGESGPGGRGLGRGRGRGAWWYEQENQDGQPEGAFSTGGGFATILVLDRSETDARCARAFRLRSGLVAAGGVALVCVGLAWLSTIRMVEARGRAGVLEAEARHLRELSQAAAGLAHETRNPLGLIRGWTQRLVQSGLNAPEQQKQAQAVVEECDRVTSRINQFLAYARPREPSIEAVDPVALIEEIATLVEPDLDAKSLRLERVGPTPPPAIRADREMLRQALFNLVRNAIQFAPEAGTVEIAVLGDQNGGCRIEVADRGPGVDLAQVDSLFTPYFTTRADGTGLGLAIVRRIAIAHGWRSGYAPREGGGSIFWLDRIHG
jgi:signal transduction histidine kinase